MNVSLKLQGINGATTKKKAKSFELRLINTSTEPGMTINFPVNSTNTSPDLRFMPQPNAYPGDTSFQTMKIVNLPSSQTGQFKIGSYDGGGWTTLIAEAILDDGTIVQGKLLVSGGERDIRIPKREANSMIAEAWLKANGNPLDTDDIETSKDNRNNGDGFTAYEEYRGVISKMEFGNHHPNNFGRLKPNKKELGIWATRRDFIFFDEGIKWFKDASKLEIIHFDFDRDEIAPDGKLNMNAKSAHDFDQYALFLLNGGLGGTLGRVYTKTGNGPNIPAQIQSVVADWNEIRNTYQSRVNWTRPETLKFAVNEYLAQTVAHELGHAVAVWHHGSDHRLDNYDAVNKKYVPYTVSTISDRIRLFDRRGNLITDRPQTLFYVGAQAGTVESGDLSCMLNYYPYYRWGFTRGADGAAIYHQEPLIPLGKIFCKTKTGTDFNATQFYFSDCAGGKGNCWGQIKLRN
ncbi:MAG: hypothetical protein HC867_03970 [Bacteroidia bacterium]|nr:hypothetical protein [Bacteroidia bacterium]